MYSSHPGDRNIVTKINYTRGSRLISFGRRDERFITVGRVDSYTLRELLGIILSPKPPIPDRLTIPMLTGARAYRTLRIRKWDHELDNPDTECFRFDLGQLVINLGTTSQSGVGEVAIWAGDRPKEVDQIIEEVETILDSLPRPEPQPQQQPERGAGSLWTPLMILLVVGLVGFGMWKAQKSPSPSP